MTNWTRIATFCLCLALPAAAAGQPTPGTDRPNDRLGLGAGLGAAAMSALAILELASCGTGCEVGSGIGLRDLALVGAGAAIGLGIAAAADRDAVPARLNGFFPGRPTVRLGAGFARASIRASTLSGKVTSPGLALAVQVSPHLSAHVEYTAMNARFSAAPGTVADSVVQNVVAASSRTAGRSFGIESRSLSPVFSEFVGFAPSPWGRVRVEFLGGLSVQQRESRDYYEAFQNSGQGTPSNPSRVERIPGKYYVLNFETPAFGFVAGVDAEVAVARGLSVVPTVRYHMAGDPGGMTSYGVGVHWRF